MIELPCRSVPELIKKNAVKFADLTALSYKKEGQWVSLSYANFYERILLTARGLRKVGVCAGDRVAIFSENRAGWVIADLGIQAIRGISVPIYATDTPEQAAYVLNHAGCKVVFVSSRMLYNKLLKVRDQIPEVETVISFERFLGEKHRPTAFGKRVEAISQAFVFGDRKAYLVALVTANVERLIEFAQQEKIDYIDLEDLASSAKVHKLFSERISLVNEKLPPHETIKKFVVLSRDFSVEGGELTPTLKLRRKVIYEKHKDKIERLYLEGSQTPTGQK